MYCMTFFCCFFIYRFNRERSITDIIFRSFWEQEIARIENQEFPDLVPFPLPVSGEVPLFSSCNNGEEDWLRLTRTVDRGGVK